MVIRQKYSYFLHVPHLADSRVRLLARSTATEAARRVHACDTAIVDRYENFAVYVQNSGVVGDRIVSGCPPLDILLNFEKQ